MSDKMQREQLDIYASKLLENNFLERIKITISIPQ